MTEIKKQTRLLQSIANGPPTLNMQHLNFEKNNFEKIANSLKNGDIVVVPTDTLYGISANAFNKNAVEQIYKIKEREQNKPFIILISNINQLKAFDIQIDKKNKDFLDKNWPAPLSVILECPHEKFAYLHRNTNSIAFRIPNNKDLLELLKLSGPITSTTVNISGEVPIININEAINKFKDKIDLYVDMQKDLTASPSTVIKLNSSGYEIIRQGTYQIKI